MKPVTCMYERGWGGGHGHSRCESNFMSFLINENKTCSFLLTFNWVPTVGSLEGFVPTGLALNLSSADRNFIFVRCTFFPVSSCTIFSQTRSPGRSVCCALWPAKLIAGSGTSGWPSWAMLCLRSVWDILRVWKHLQCGEKMESWYSGFGNI